MNYSEAGQRRPGQKYMGIDITGRSIYRRPRRGLRQVGLQPGEIALEVGPSDAKVETQAPRITCFPAFFTRVFRQPPTTLREIQRFYLGVLPSKQDFDIRPDVEGIIVKTDMGIFAQVSGIQGMVVSSGVLDYSRRINPSVRRKTHK